MTLISEPYLSRLMPRKQRTFPLLSAFSVLSSMLEHPKPSPQWSLPAEDAVASTISKRVCEDPVVWNVAVSTTPLPYTSLPVVQQDVTAPANAQTAMEITMQTPWSVPFVRRSHTAR